MDKCAACGSASTMAAFDKVVCLNPDCSGGGGGQPVLDPNLRDAEIAAEAKKTAKGSTK